MAKIFINFTEKTSKMSVPERVLAKMLENDHFSKWLGLVVESVTEGSCRLHFVVRRDMLNGFGTIHGGALFAAADSAFAFACNAHGRLSVALDVSITFTKSATEGETLSVEAREVHLGQKTSVYDVVVRNAEGATIALFKGTAYRTEKTVI